MESRLVRATRLTVDHILHEMGTGMTDHELLENYPTLVSSSIRAHCSMPLP